MRVLIADKFDDAGVRGLEDAGCDVSVRPELDAQSLPDALAEHKSETLIVRSTKVPASALESASSLRLIIRAGSGYDNIDSSFAAERGVPVCNCPGMNAVAVAELTMGLLLTLDRRIPDQVGALRDGQWNKKAFSKSRGLKGRSLLVIGAGAIGTEVIRRAQAFGMRVACQSRSLREDTSVALGIEPIPYSREALFEALPRMDAVSVHVALVEETKNLCDARFFEAIKPGAYFINTSRGDVVDESALARAIEAKGVRAGLDVYQDQPSFKEGAWRTPMAELDAVFGTHHCGASTDQAQLAVAEETVRIVREFKDSGRVLHCVNGVA
ncbi:MAG: NAD(P)-dependent oxidoreductase [Planctomycetota bacterium]